MNRHVILVLRSHFQGAFILKIQRTIMQTPSSSRSPVSSFGCHAASPSSESRSPLLHAALLLQVVIALPPDMDPGLCIPLPLKGRADTVLRDMPGTQGRHCPLMQQSSWLCFVTSSLLKTQLWCFPLQKQRAMKVALKMNSVIKCRMQGQK